MKKIGLLFVFCALGFFYSSTAKGQLVLQFGYEKVINRSDVIVGDNIFYMGAGYNIADRFMLTGEVGLSSEFIVPKGDVSVRFLRLREAEVDFYLGAGYGYSFEKIEGLYPSQMLEGLLTVQYHGFLAGYALGTYDSTHPKLDGIGTYHYFKVGILLD